jgi:DNA-binding FrmR family transcriptional regulator
MIYSRKRRLWKKRHRPLGEDRACLDVERSPAAVRRVSGGLAAFVARRVAEEHAPAQEGSTAGWAEDVMEAMELVRAV